MTTQPVPTEELDLSLVRGGALYSLLVKSGIAKPGVSSVVVRIAFYVLATWIPMAALSWFQGQELGIPLLSYFLRNFEESVRFLFVIPLLIFAELQIQPWLSHVVRYFVKSGLVPDDETPKYLKFIQHAQSMRNSVPVELGLLAFAFCTSAFGVHLVLNADDGTWQTVNGELTMAGAWFKYVAMPACRFLWLRWWWRVAIWWSLLARISTLKLRLVPTHPDCEGGLGFLASGHNNFALLCLALSSQLSSVMAQEILYHGHTLEGFKGTILLTIILMVTFSILPLLVFSPKLIECKRKGLYEYGILAKQYVDSYHSKWVHGAIPDDSTAEKPSEPDSKVAEKFNSVGKMRPVAFNQSTIFAFAMAAAAPFAPLLLTIYRFDQLLDQVVKKLI